MKVSDILRLLGQDGWYLASTRGSHRQFKHPTKPGRVTGCGEAKRRFGTGHIEQYPQAIGTEEIGSFSCVTRSLLKMLAEITLRMCQISPDASLPVTLLLLPSRQFARL